MSEETELNPMAETLLGLSPEEPEKAIPDDPAEEPSAEASGEPESPNTDEEPTEEPTTYSVKELAEKLEVRPQDLYASLQIDVGGKTMSLSELKDRGKDLHAAEDKLERVTADQEEYERQRLRDNRTYQLMAQRAGREPTEADIAEAERMQAEWSNQQAAALLAAKPELADADTRSATEQKMLTFLAEYGLSKVETEQLLSEHRVFLVIAQAADMADRLARAEKSIQPAKSHKSGKRRPYQPKRTADNVKRDYRDGKIGQNTAVAALLADGATGDGSI